jgi:hypothetical protein
MLEDARGIQKQFILPPSTTKEFRNLAQQNFRQLKKIQLYTGENPQDLFQYHAKVNKSSAL